MIGGGGYWAARNIGVGNDSQSCEKCEPITLANAPAGYAAIKLADGFQSNGLVEIERLFVDAPPMSESKRESAKQSFVVALEHCNLPILHTARLLANKQLAYERN